MGLRVGLVGGAGVVLVVLAVLILAPQPRVLEVPPEELVLRDVTIVNPGDGRRPNQTLWVRGGFLERIETSTDDAATGPYAGAFVLPGLIDLHVHHPPAWALGERELFALLFLSHGATSVRDTGSLYGSVAGHAARIAAGELVGPRVFHCGRVLDGAPSGWAGARLVPRVHDGVQAVRDLAAEGADCVKVYSRVSAPVLRAIRAQSAARGLPLVAHVPEEASLEHLGGAEVQHLMGLTDDWWQVAPSRIEWYVETSRARGIAHTPTLVAFARSARIEDYETLLAEPFARLLPRHYREIVWNPELSLFATALLPAGGVPGERRLVAMKQVVAALREAGVPVLAGTDAGNPFVVPGESLHEELRLLREAGFTAEEAWEAASRRAGEALGVPGLGVVRERAPADLLVFGEDPSRDLTALSTLRAVVADGRLYPKDSLDEAVARRRAGLEGLPRGPLAAAVARVIVAAANARIDWDRSR